MFMRLSGCCCIAATTTGVVGKCQQINTAICNSFQVKWPYSKQHNIHHTSNTVRVGPSGAEFNGSRNSATVEQ